VTYCDVQGGFPGTGNIDADPVFLDPGSGDFHLDPGSPCIDVGTNDAPDLPPYDFEGDDRIIDGDGDSMAVVDMGVDEVALQPPAIGGSIRLNGERIPNRMVILRQIDEPDQQTTTGPGGRYGFESAVSGKAFRVIIYGGLVPGEVVLQSPAVSGCLWLNGEPHTSRTVILRQIDEPDQETTTGSQGCYGFESAVSGIAFQIIIQGGLVP
jgi:hypothetical protein